MTATNSKQKVLARELRPRGRLQKQLANATLGRDLIIIKNNNIEINEKVTITLLEVTMSMTKVNSKIYKSELYNKVINNLIHSRCQREAIKEKLQNLEKYEELLSGTKTIGSK